MVRAHVCALLGFGLMLAAASTEARELNFLVDSNIGADTNVFQRVDNTKADGYWEFSPRIAVKDSRDTLEYDFSYRPTYQGFFATNGINGWDHYGKADLDWRPTKADSVSFGGSIVSSRSVRQFIDEDLSVPATDPDRFNVVETDRERVVRSIARIGYNRSVNPSTSARIDLNFEDLAFSDEQNVDTRSYSATVSSTRVFDARTQAGLSGTGRYREGRGLDYLDPPPAPIVLGQFSSQTLTGDISLFFVRAITPSIRLSARAGPSFTRTETNAPPGRDADPNTASRDRTASDKNLSFVADISLAKQWRHSAASIGYTRFESGTGGSSSASIVDQVSFNANHRPSRQWNLNMNLTWNRRKTISSVGAIGKETFQRYSVSASAAYAISRQFSIIGRSSYRRFGNQSRITVPVQDTSTQNTEIFVSTVTLRYTFDPVIF